MVRRGALAGLVIAVLGALPAQAQVDPAFLPESAQQWVKARTRAADQLAHPGFTQLSAPMYPAMPTDANLVGQDPYRLGWSRGETLEVDIANRYGARMHGRLYSPTLPWTDPVTGKKRSGELPAVIVLTGGAGDENAYQEFSQGLAEAGYVVLGLDVQGDGYSEAAPPDPVPATPENEYCRPGNHDDWQAPKELGVAEQEACAGGYNPPPALPVPDPVALAPALADFYLAMVDGNQPPPGVNEYYERVRSRKLFGALDAVRWLLSADNPRGALIDPERIGIAGHSLGAHGALLAGNGDPLERFDAVVSWDSFGTLRTTTPPRVPTMFMHHEFDFGLPKRERHDLEKLMPGYADAAAFRAEQIPTAMIVPDASTHQDFGFLNFPPVWVGATVLGLCPDCILAANSTRDGQRVVLHYTQAWFDRFLKTGNKQRDDARARLLARTYPESADASSIGQGTWDPATGANRPYEIGGESAAGHLSPLARSFAYLDGIACADLRAGCTKHKRKRARR